MVTFSEQSTALVRILLITLSRFCLPALCKGGALGMYSVHSLSHAFTISFSRCTAKRTDLDGESGWCSCEHTELLVNEFELGTLWDEYGLVGNIIVSTVLTIYLYCC